MTGLERTIERSYQTHSHNQFSSVQFSRSVVSDSLWPHELQHIRPPCTSSSPRVHSNSRPSSRWCHPAISSSVIPFSSCLQSFPASGSFLMKYLLEFYCAAFDFNIFPFSSVQSLCGVWLFVTPWIAALQASLFFTNPQSSLKLTTIESVMPSSHLILGRPLLLPPIPPSIRVFSNESTLCMRRPKYWSFSFQLLNKLFMVSNPESKLY